MWAKRESDPQRSVILNKNIYDRDVLIWSAYTPVTAKLLENARKRGIRLSEDDLIEADEALLAAADTAFDELGAVFREAGCSGRVCVRELRRTAIPVLKNCLSAGSLAMLLVHLRRKDDPTLRHSMGVGALSLMLGRWMKLDEDELDRLALAALLHDIGKLKVDRRLLNKPGPLTAAEYEEMKRHTVYGYELLRGAEGIAEACALPALRHHERFDGSGYPNRLTGPQLDLFSRTIAVTDVFHAMVSKRSYKEGLPFFQVIREMHASAFGQFDPEIAIVFLRNMMESLIGSDIMLTNGKRARIVAMNASDPFRPLVQVQDEFVDLSKKRSIHIQGLDG